MGLSGCCAALTAAEEGASVIGIEQQNEINVTGISCIGLLGGTRWLRAQGIDYSQEEKNEAIWELMRWSGNRADERFYRTWLNKSEEYGTG
jgi:succinate dehydrogenase/fumarate reductase flavoprotein subunit